MSVLGIEFLSGWHLMAIGVILIAAEALIPGVLFLWVGGGLFAVGTFLWAWPEAHIGIQVVALAAFMVASVFLGLRFQARSKAKEGEESLNAGLQSMKGRKATASVGFVKHGRVYVGDSFYSAYSENEIKDGESVIVSDVVDGVLHVKPN